MIQIQTEQQFREAISSNQPTVVKFYTSWCPDCKRVNTFIDDVMANHTEYQWFDLNGEDLPDVSEECQVMGVPSLLIFKNGKKIAHLHSRFAKTRPEIEEFLETRESKTI